LPTELRHRKVLIAPLNWGLGHVTRCIPIITALENMGVEVFLASDGVALHLLRAEFPHLKSFELTSYDITYRSNNMFLNISSQLPKIRKAIHDEHYEVVDIVYDNDITAIISDNRYGCYVDGVESILLTHQLTIQHKNPFLRWFSRTALYNVFRNFDNIWVPDNADDVNLSGELSHRKEGYETIKYIGILSRMKAYPREREYDVAIVLSGPEPQRTILEQKLMEQAVELPQDFIIIQGKTQSKKHYFAADNVEVVSYLTSKELNDTLMASRVIVCRSGYSSLMDLATLGKKAILIPTPGQTEQEYLAKRCHDQKIFVTQKQDKIDLEQGILDLSNVRGFQTGMFDAEVFEEVLKEWLIV
jgi:predicted glycosyltransferase